MLLLFLACTQDNTAQEYPTSVVEVFEQEQDDVSFEMTDEDEMQGDSEQEANGQESPENHQDQRGDGELLNEKNVNVKLLILLQMVYKIY